VTIRVLLADDQAMIRSGLRLILEDQDDITVVGEAADGSEAVELARRLRPDVCLVDIRMPRLDGIEVTRALAGPGVSDPLRVVVVTTFDLDEYVYGALHAGAVGFVLKGAAPALLIEAVRAATVGDALLSPAITLRLLRNLAPTRGTTVPQPGQPLSPRELEVVQAIARGRTNQEIAAELFISLSTVKSHVATIQGKLRVRNRVEIAAWAWEGCSSGCIHPRSRGPTRAAAKRSIAGQDADEPARPPLTNSWKRVGGNPSRVRILFPPQAEGPDRSPVRALCVSFSVFVSVRLFGPLFNLGRGGLGLVLGDAPQRLSDLLGHGPQHGIGDVHVPGPHPRRASWLPSHDGVNDPIRDAEQQQDCPGGVAGVMEAALTNSRV